VLDHERGTRFLAVMAWSALAAVEFHGHQPERTSAAPGPVARSLAEPTAISHDLEASTALASRTKICLNGQPP
jgi:hypothetical protein